MAASSNRARGRRRWFGVGSLLAAALALAIGTVLWQTVDVHSVSGVAEQLDRWRGWLSGLRLSVIALAAVFWARFPRLWRRQDPNDTAVHARWMAWRWRVCGWLLGIELIIGQNLMGRLVGVMGLAP